MSKNHSPWIHELNRVRPLLPLQYDFHADVAIVGGGIAGISSAFFILQETDKKVVVLESGKVAHGATGHNAGQVTYYFERPFVELVEEFGLKKASEGVKSVEQAWELLEEIYTTAQLDIPLSRFIGFDGFSTFDQIIAHLKDNSLRREGGLSIQTLYVSDTVEFKNEIPTEYEGLYKIVPDKEVLARLETARTNFLAVAEQQKGTINSALFTEEVAGYLLKNFKDRFFIFENSKVHKVVLKSDHALLDVGKACVTAKRVLLCTNGFENFEIFNTSGLAINTSFHHMINGVVARMSGYLESMNKAPTAINYYMDPTLTFGDVNFLYFYLTRRMYEYNHNKHNLICIGGPDHNIGDREEYLFEFEYPDEVQKGTDEFLRSLYDLDPNRKLEYIFSWHGLMGYTPNRVRRIGAEPLNPVLLYNLGCNGVGILPSIYGGKRISEILQGKELADSIFDPGDQTQVQSLPHK